jgi:ankyrin repeat protein
MLRSWIVRKSPWLLAAIAVAAIGAAPARAADKKPDKKATAALLKAAKDGSAAEVTKAIAARADLTACDDDGNTALALAASGGS